MEGFNDKEFIAKLEELKRRDLDEFMKLALFALKTHPDEAVKDDAPPENKIAALKTLLSHFEEKEEYEDCAFIRDLKKEIEDAEKR